MHRVSPSPWGAPVTAPTVAFEWRPLVDRVDPRAVKDHVRMLRAQGRVRGSSSIAIVVGVVAAVVVLGGFFSIGGVVIAAIAAGGLFAAPFALVPMLFVVGLIALVVFLAVRGTRSRDERWLRLDRFAQANGMSFVPSIPEPHLPGMIFNRGSSREATDLVRGAQPRFVEFGNYRFVTGSGKSRTTHQWGYVAVKLDVPLPHIVLDATGNNGLFGSNLPHLFDRDQRLSLEGDFDQHFALYCPQGYERDALYLFTPDIMARFIDHAAQLDVEIVDDWLFLYAKRDLSTLDPATWAWLFTAVAALLDKFAQWARWRDDRLAGSAAVHAGASAAPTATLPGGAASGIPGAQTAGPAPLITPPPGVAQPGRRLKGGFSWIALLIVGVVVLSWVFMVAGGFGIFLGR